MNAAEFGRWVSEYNAAGIDNACTPSRNAVEQTGSCAFVVCSDLPRSLESARALGLETIGACDSQFREMDMPYSEWRFPRLSPSAWSVLFRLAWAFGYSSNAESFEEARRRARGCAERLAEYAAEHGKVLFVGHGSLNWFIARRLKRMGWSGPNRSPRTYWEYGVYRYRPLRP